MLSIIELSITLYQSMQNDSKNAHVAPSLERVYFMSNVAPLFIFFRASTRIFYSLNNTVTSIHPLYYLTLLYNRRLITAGLY